MISSRLRCPVVVLFLVSAAAILLPAHPALQIPVPGSPVPVSLRSLGVLLATLLLGAGPAMALTAGWIALGAAGLPVMKGLEGGLPAVTGPSRGYLVGLVLAPLVLTAIGRASSPVRIFIGAVAAHATVLGAGAAGLATLGVAGPRIWENGMAPFLPGGVLKSAILAASACALMRLAPNQTGEARRDGNSR